MNDTVHFAAGSRVYVDTNIFIYFIETVGPLHRKVSSLFEVVQNIGARLVTSEMTLAECLFRPAREKNGGLIHTYELLLEDSANVEMVPIDGDIVKKAALSAGGFGLKLIDSIHLVSAFAGNCDFFLTNDSAFKSTLDLTVIHVAP